MPRKPRLRKIPVGWRILTPSEVLKEGDYVNAKSNVAPDNVWLNNPRCQKELANGILTAGYQKPYKSEIGKKPYHLLFAIRRKSPVSSVALTNPTDTSDGTKPANTETLG